MEILEAYDLTGSYRAATELAGCDHHRRPVCGVTGSRTKPSRARTSIPSDRRVSAQGRRTGGAFQRQGSRRCGAPADPSIGIHGWRTHDTAGGGPGRAATQNRAAAVSVDGVRYSVPHTLADSRVWVRFHGDELIVTAVGDGGPVEVARHRRSTPALRRLMRSTIHRAGITTVSAPHGRIHRRRPAARSKRLQHNAPSDIVSNPQEW